MSSEVFAFRLNKLLFMKKISTNKNQMETETNTQNNFFEICDTYFKYNNLSIIHKIQILLKGSMKKFIVYLEQLFDILS